MEKPTKIIIHIPHSKIYIPVKYLDSFCISQSKMQDELLKTTDMYTDELFSSTNNTIVFPISRLVCDVERFREKSLERMNEKGMWVCYTKTSDLKELRKTNEFEIYEILTQYYDEHHKQLTKLVDLSLKKYSRCLIIDGHSFSSTPLLYENEQSLDRPDICIGTDYIHTPKEITRICKQYFENYGYSVKINSPFSGCIIPMKYYKNSNNVLRNYD